MQSDNVSDFEMVELLNEPRSETTRGLVMSDSESDTLNTDEVLAVFQSQTNPWKDLQINGSDLDTEKTFYYPE